MAQVIANSLAAASVYTLVAIGFALIYSTVRFFNFAHAVVYTIGAYGAYTVAITFSLGWWIGLGGGILLSSAVGIVLEICIYRRMRRWNASATTLFITSLGLLVAAQNLLSLLFGDQTLVLRRKSFDRIFDVLSARITQSQVEGFLLAAILCFATWLVLRLTVLGREIRAIANDPDLAQSTGISVDKVVVCVFAAGSALAGLAAIIFADQTDVKPDIGMHVLLMAVVVQVISGTHSIPGIALAACLISFLRNLSIWLWPAQWGETITFLLLIIFLLIRPQGVFGQRSRTVAA